MFRLLHIHNTRLDLASDPHEIALNFIDSTPVRPTLDKSSDTESDTDPNHPSFRNPRRQRPMFRLIYTHSTRLDLASDPHASSLNCIDSTLV